MSTTVCARVRRLSSACPKCKQVAYPYGIDPTDSRQPVTIGELYGYYCTACGAEWVAQMLIRRST
jgi:hypothetical protein